MSKILIIAVCLTFAAPAYGQLSEAEFRRLHDELNPQDEKWKSIPWQISLLEAQHVAAAKKKTNLHLGDGWAPLGMHVKQRSTRPCVDVSG